MILSHNSGQESGFSRCGVIVASKRPKINKYTKAERKHQGIMRGGAEVPHKQLLREPQ